MIFLCCLVVDGVIPEGGSEMSSFYFFQVPLGVHSCLPASFRSTLLESGWESLCLMLFREIHQLLLFLYSFGCP